MKKIKSLGLFILTIVLCFSSLVSCQSSQGEDMTGAADTAAPVDTLGENQKPLPDVNYGGYDFNVALRSSTDFIATSYESDMFAEAEATDIVSEAVYHRNFNVQEKYGIQLNCITMSTGNDGGEALTKIQSGDNSYALVIPHGRRAATFAINGAAVNWNALPYVNLDCEWWNQSLRECCSFYGNLYFMTGDISHLNTGSAYCQVFNEEMLKEKNIALPYQAVKDGTWTFETFSEIVKMCAEELDGNPGILLGSERDVVGYCAYAWSTPYCAAYASGQKIISKDAEGAPVITIANELTFESLEKLFNLINTDGCHINPEDDITSGVTAFVKEQVAFFDTTLNVISSQIRTEDVPYGIVPFPKMNDTVDGYRAHCEAMYGLLVVPTTSDDLERTSVILEALCQEGNKLVIPAYYEKVIEGRTAQNFETYEMLPIIANSRVYDFGYYNMELGKMSELLHDMGVMGSADSFYKLYQQYTRQSNKRLEQLVEAYQKLAEATDAEA